jgi:hypothetical protein
MSTLERMLAMMPCIEAGTCAEVSPKRQTDTAVRFDMLRRLENGLA